MKDMTPERTEKLLNYNGSDRIITFQEKQQEIEQVNQGKETKKITIAKFPDMNRAIKYFGLGDLILLTGKPKSGKTLYAQTLTLDFQKEHDISSLWFQYEVMPEMFLESFPEGVIPLIGYLPREMKAGSSNWLEERIDEALIKDEARNGQRTLYAVFVDHIHFVFDIFKSRNPSIEIGQIVRQLKTIAIEKQLIIFVMCHMKKVLTDEPSGYDARDSSFLMGECDKSFTMWRLQDEENISVLKVDVDRRTGALARKFKLLKTPKGYFREVAEVVDDEQTDKRWWL